MNKIKCFYLIKGEILFNLPLKRVLQLFKSSTKYLNLLQLSPKIYELYHNIKKDFELYNPRLYNNMLTYIVHFSRIQKNISMNILQDYFFRFLLEQKTIKAEYDNVYFEPLLIYLNSKKYYGTLIIELSEPKIDLNIRPNIEINNQKFFLEINFNMKWIDREKKENMDYFRNFLENKIIGKNTRNKVTKIHFFEKINLSEEKYENFFFDLISLFPNALFNIQSDYFDDEIYWSELDKFSSLKIIINEIIDKKEIQSDKSTNNNNININVQNDNNLLNKIQKEEYLTKIKKLNDNILSIKELNDFTLDFRKNEISIVKQFFDVYKSQKQNNNYKNQIIPSSLTLINFKYENNKEYFSELDNNIDTLQVIQRIYKNTPYPFFISPNLKSLQNIYLERINILEQTLVSIVNNNPLLEIIEISKNYTGYVYGYNLALALSKLNYLKSLNTEFFWYKDNIPNFHDNNLINKQENEFFKFFTSKTLLHLSLSNETNININTLNQNLPNLITLSMSFSNILEENNYNNFDSNIKDNIISKKNSCEIKDNTNKFSIRNHYKKKMSQDINKINDINEFNFSQNEKFFSRLRELSMTIIENSDEFFKKIAFFNSIENLYLDDFPITFMDTFVKYGHYLNNLDILYIYPDLSRKIHPHEMENLVKNLHYFNKLTVLTISFYCINENLVNLFYKELIRLPLLNRLKIIVKVSSDENKEILKKIINKIKTQNFNSKFLTITYNFLDIKYK